MEVFCISSGAMISSGLFVLPGVASGMVGPGIIVAYLLASLLAIPTIMAKAELSTAMPKTGGIFFMTDRSMGPLMGTLGGFSAWFSLALKSAFALFGIGIFATLIEDSLGNTEVKAIAVSCCIFFMLVNILGAKLSARFQVGLVLSLIAILVLYILLGLFFINADNYTPFLPKGVTPVVSTAGLVFVSFAGSTKVAAVAGEIKKPGRNIPLGIILSWAIVSLLYVTVIGVTVGIMDGGQFASSTTPLSDGGGILLGSLGIIVMSIGGMLAFVSTGNAGIMAASRDPMAMGEDHLLPSIFGKVSRWGTPAMGIVITTGFMIGAIILTDVKQLAAYASTLKLLLFILACLALIFMRESNIKHYRPKFKAPFYPWLQVVGIVGYSILILLLGWEKILAAVIFIIAGIGWYFIYSHGKIRREYALLHVAKRMMGEERDEYLLDEELREILIDRDQILRSRFLDKVKNAAVIDLDYMKSPAKMSEMLAYTFSEKIGCDCGYRKDEFTKEDRKAHMITMPHFVLMSYMVKGKNIYDIAVVRTKRGAIFSEASPPVHAAFVILFTPDEKSFYLNSLMWLIKGCEKVDFEGYWRKAENEERLKQMIIKGIETEKDSFPREKPIT